MLYKILIYLIYFEIINMLNIFWNLINRNFSLNKKDILLCFSNKILYYWLDF